METKNWCRKLTSLNNQNEQVPMPKKATKRPVPKKPTKDQIYTSLGCRGKPGRRLTKPENVKLRLEHLIKECSAWMRQVCEVWFDPYDPHIESAIATADHFDILMDYDDAIQSMLNVAGYAEVAVEILQAGKAESEQKTKASKMPKPTKAKP
jgi:hypothetical protein